MWSQFIKLCFLWLLSCSQNNREEQFFTVCPGNFNTDEENCRNQNAEHQNVEKIHSLEKKITQSLHYPPARKASREVPTLTERKNSHTPEYDVKEFVCLSVCYKL